MYWHFMGICLFSSRPLNLAYIGQEFHMLFKQDNFNSLQSTFCDKHSQKKFELFLENDFWRHLATWTKVQYAILRLVIWLLKLLTVALIIWSLFPTRSWATLIKKWYRLSLLPPLVSSQMHEACPRLEYYQKFLEF